MVMGRAEIRGGGWEGPATQMGKACLGEREHLRGFVLCSFCLYCGNVGRTLQISLGLFNLVYVCVCVCVYFVQTCDIPHWRVLPCLFPMLSSEMVSHWTYKWPVGSCLYLPSTGISGACPCSWLLREFLGPRSVLVPARPTFYQWNHLSTFAI